MKIESIQFENFRGFPDLTLQLNGKNAVLCGINGAGKSAVLSGITFLLAPLIREIYSLKAHQVPLIQADDIHTGQKSCTLSCTLIGEDLPEPASLSTTIRHLTKKKTGMLSGSYRSLAEAWKENLGKEGASTPVFVCYGTRRYVADAPSGNLIKQPSDSSGIPHSISENGTGFRTFFEWFRQREDLENERKVREDPDYEDLSLKSVRTAVTSVLEDVSDLHIERNPLAMKVMKGTTFLRIEQLSDGEKCILVLFGDLARRLSLANPGSENPLLGQGIVCIDELELHLHPSWQRRIFPALKETFPNIQLIVTTHSPLILGELNDEYNIISLQKEDDRIEANVIDSLIGWDANYIIKDFMNTENLSSYARELIRNLYEAIQEKDLDQARKFRDELEKLTSSNQEDVIKADLLIRRIQKNMEKE